MKKTTFPIDPHSPTKEKSDFENAIDWAAEIGRAKVSTKSVYELFATLPIYITYQGIEFTPKLIKNNNVELRLVYEVYRVDDESPHYESYENYGCFKFNGTNQSFLYLIENIESDEMLGAGLELLLSLIADHAKLNIITIQK